MTTTSVARPDYEAHVRATRSTFPEVVQEMRGILGAKLCAYLGSVRKLALSTSGRTVPANRVPTCSDVCALPCKRLRRSQRPTQRRSRKPGFKG